MIQQVLLLDQAADQLTTTQQQPTVHEIKYNYAEDKINDFLKCPSCHNPFIDPMTHTPCKTTYCYKCIMKNSIPATTTNTNNSGCYCCIKCSEPIDFKKNCFKSHQLIQDMLDKLKVKCEMCRGIVLRGELKDHMNQWCPNLQIEALKLKLVELNQQNEQLKCKLKLETTVSTTPLISNDTGNNNNKPIQLNVGGTIMSVSLGTFSNEIEPDHVLKNILTNNHTTTMPSINQLQFNDPIYFIDCKPVVFDYLIEWLQYGSLLADTNELSQHMKKSILQASNKFKLKNLSKMMEIELNKKEILKKSQFVKLINLKNQNGLNLSGFDLTQLVLQHINLEKSIIISSNFSGMNLTHSNFKNSILRGSIFAGCDLTSVDFSGCDLSECDFSNAILKQTKFTNATNISPSLFENVIFQTKFSSAIINDNNFINKIMSHSMFQSQPQSQLLYRGTRDGFKAEHFHSKCDNQGPTLTIIKSEHNQIFGGFTDQSWKSAADGEWFSDATSFIFKCDDEKLKSVRIFKIRQNRIDKAIYAHSNYLSIFGIGHDIRIFSDCNVNSDSFSNFGNSYELPNEDDFQIKSEKARNYLAGSFKFKVLEIEVFKITTSGTIN